MRRAQRKKESPTSRSSRRRGESIFSGTSGGSADCHRRALPTAATGAARGELVYNAAAMKPTMTDNPIVDEVHRIREQMLAAHGGDLRALIANAQCRTEEAARAGHKILSPPQRPNARVIPTKKAG